MKNIKVLDKYDIEVQQAMLDCPNLNGTELAQLLAGGYRGDLYPKYVKYVQAYNYLKREVSDEN